MTARIDVNHAGAEELTAIPGIDEERARLIVEYRSAHGPFHEWRDVEQVPGIGPVLTERIREEAALGEDLEEEEEQEEEAAAPDEAEIAALVAIANLDREAAMTYDAVANLVDDDELREMLRGFAGDHWRHVDDLVAIARERGATIEDKGEGGSILVGLAMTLGALHQDAAIEALVANEELTNGTYETAVWLVSGTIADPIIERNAADEQRHLRALLEYQRTQES